MDVAESRSAAAAPALVPVDGDTTQNAAVGTSVDVSGEIRARGTAETSGVAAAGVAAEVSSGAVGSGGEQVSGSSATVPGTSVAATGEVEVAVATGFEMTAAEEWGAQADLEVNGGGIGLAALAGVGVMVEGVPTALAQLDRPLRN